MELNPMESKVLEALKALGATGPEKIKTADDVMKKSDLAKGVVGNCLTSLVGKGAVKRVAREKAAGYYAIQQA
ncbi:BlaI/MecI/CopY family transcriptional regulator [Candidatus Micrarchaeota archaeon]|nr:BlaI/MecI/CopY family transcriptional regulator [Candidatus Micrarchaeota archaeon]